MRAMARLFGSEDNGNDIKYRDSMDSSSPGEGGYHTEGIIGVPWATQKYPLILPLKRYRSTATNDHGSTTCPYPSMSVKRSLAGGIGAGSMQQLFPRWSRAAC